MRKRVAIIGIAFLVSARPAFAQSANTMSAISQGAALLQGLTGQATSIETQRQMLQQQRLSPQQQALSAFARYCPNGWHHEEALLADGQSTATVCVQN
jgi:hypothetical protein